MSYAQFSPCLRLHACGGVRSHFSATCNPHAGRTGLSSSMPFRPCIAGRSAASAKHDAYTARPACAYRCRLCDFSALHSACRFTLVVAVWLLVATLSLNGCDKPSLVASASTPGSSMAPDVRLYAATTIVVAVKPSRFRMARMSGHQVPLTLGSGARRVTLSHAEAGSAKK